MPRGRVSRLRVIVVTWITLARFCRFLKTNNQRKATANQRGEVIFAPGTAAMLAARQPADYLEESFAVAARWQS
jgi:hypothetical protein